MPTPRSKSMLPPSINDKSDDSQGVCASAATGISEEINDGCFLIEKIVPVEDCSDTTEEKENEFFFHDIEEMVPLKDCDSDNKSYTRSNITSGIIKISRSDSNFLWKEDADATSSSNTKKLSSIKRSSSESILKTSSSYLTSDNGKCSNDEANLKPSTSFSTLEIREYPITLGDNPGGNRGPPISLDWNYNEEQTQVVPLDDYEETRPPRRSLEALYMTDDTRIWRLLREKKVPIKEIQKATKAVETVRHQRKKSLESKSGPLSGVKKWLGIK